jgi:hypothetical protein
MNERFRPVLDWGQEIETNTVMIMDDDVVLRKEALEWGYQQFLEANKYGPGRIVGFSPREFEKVGGGGGKANEWKYLTKPRESYSMILSNAAFLKKEWLTKYWEDSQEMRQLRNYVDSGKGLFVSRSLSPEFVHRAHTLALTFLCYSVQLRRHLDKLRRIEPYSLSPSSTPTVDSSSNGSN